MFIQLCKPTFDFYYKVFNVRDGVSIYKKPLEGDWNGASDNKALYVFPIINPPDG